MKDLLTVTLKTEMSRFDHPGMNRTYRHFVNLFPLYPVVVHHPHLNRLAGWAAPGIPPWTVRTDEPDRLEPGMSFKTDTALLGNFTFKQL
jgi:hypothetical protein